MAKNVIPNKLEDVVEMLKVVQSGDNLYAGEDFALTAELRTKVDDSVTAIDNSKMDVVSTQGIKETVVQQSNEKRKESRAVISRTKSYLVSQMPKLQKDKLLQGYLLDNAMPQAFNGIFRVLQAIVQENTAQVGEAWELPAPILIDATAVRDAMATLQISVEAAKGAYHEAMQNQRNAKATGRVMLRRVREYLYAMLPERKKDMKLKEFGLDPWD